MFINLFSEFFFYQNLKSSFTLGMVVFNMFNIVVIVSTEVIPSAIRAAVESGGIQNDIHDKITISAHGA